MKNDNSNQHYVKFAEEDELVPDEGPLQKLKPHLAKYGLKRDEGGTLE